MYLFKKKYKVDYCGKKIGIRTQKTDTVLEKRLYCITLC